MAGQKNYRVSFQFGATVTPGLMNAFSQSQKGVKGLNTGLVNAQRQAGVTNRALGSLSSGLKTLAGIAGAYFGLRAVTGFFKGAINTFAEFEEGMSEVKAISGATGEDFDLLSQKAKDLGKNTSKSAYEAAQAMKYQALAGWDVKTILASTQPILRLSEAGKLDLARASDIVTDSMSSLGLSADQLPEYLDKMAQTSRKANTDIDALGEAFIVAGGTFKNFNTPLHESNTILAILANRGKKGSEAGNALNSIMVNLTTGAGQAGKAMEELKINAFDSEGNFKGMANVLKEVNEKTKDMTQEQRNMYLSMIGGKTQLDTLQALLAGVGDEFDALQEDIKNSDGALEDLAKTMQDNLKGAFSRLGSAVEGFKIDFSEKIGKSLTPVVDRFAARITDAGPIVIKAFESIQAFIGTNVLPRFNTIKTVTGEIAQVFFPNLSLSAGEFQAASEALVTGGLDLVIGGLSWVRDNSDFIKTMVLGLTTAYATQKGILIGLTVAQQAQNIAMAVSKGYHIANRALIIAKTTATITGSGAIGAITAAQWLWNAALAANPIGVVIVVVAGLAVGIYALYKNFDKVTGAIKKAWDWLTKWTKTDPGEKNLKVNTYETKHTAQSGNPPKFAKGVRNFGGGMALVGEEGPELVHLSKGSNVETKNRTRSILNSMTSSNKPSVSSSSESFHITYAPQITIQGNADPATIKQATDESFTSFKRNFNQLTNQNKRLSFAK